MRCRWHVYLLCAMTSVAVGADNAPQGLSADKLQTPVEFTPPLNAWKFPPSAAKCNRLFVAPNLMQIFAECDSLGGGLNERQDLLFSLIERKTIDLRKLLQEGGRTSLTGIRSVSFSANGNYLAAVGETRSHNVAFVVELSTQKVIKLLDEDNITLMWGGDHLFMSSDDKRVVSKIRMLDMNSPKMTELAITGMLLPAGGDENSILCICDSKTLGRTIGTAELPKLDVCRITLTPKPKVQEILCPGREVMGGFAMSRDGRISARAEVPSQSPAATHPAERTIKVRSVGTSGESNEWSVKGKGRLLGVTNKGSVVLFDESSGNGSVTLIDAQGKSRELVPSAQAAAMSATHAMAYITSGTPLAIQAFALPVSEAVPCE